MKEAIIKLDAFMTKGLAPNNNRRNNPLLTTATGAMVYAGSLTAVQDLTAFQIDLTYWQAEAQGGPIAWPYPQLFPLSDIVVICLETKILELRGSNVVQMLTGLTAGYAWSVIDFHSYLYLTNGAVAVTRDPHTLAYAVDATVPYGMAACDFNGQVLVGGTPIFS